MNIYGAVKRLMDMTPREVLHKIIKKVPMSNSLEEVEAVFVLSTGRVGSQTIAALLSLGKGLSVYHEPQPYLFGLSKLCFAENIGSDNPIVKEAFLTTRRELISRAWYLGDTYIETSPQATFLAPVISEAMPKSKFIHIVREPTDVIMSGVNRKWFDGNKNDIWRIHPGENDKWNWESMNVIEKNAWLWAETNKWIVGFMRSLDDSRKMTVRSCDIFSGDKDTITKLYEFVGSETASINSINSILKLKLNKTTTLMEENNGLDFKDYGCVESYVKEVQRSLAL